VEHSGDGFRFTGMGGLRVVLAWGVFLALPLIASAQAETDGVEPSTPSTTRTIAASGVETPFADVTVADAGAAAVVDEVAPQATPSPHEKLPPGPPSRWP
jgi:hypothetical protein